MKKILVIIALFCGLFFTLGQASWADGSHRIGVGTHYWVTADDIDKDNIDENGLAIIASYQYLLTEHLKFEVGAEYLKEGYAGSDKSVFSPLAYILIGKGLYAGAGIGINHSGGEFADEPLYALRAGIDLEILPLIFLDINANYRFEKWDFDEIEDDIDGDTITIGAILRLQF
ncbi:MAG: hypothetical protein LWW97_06035 [Deltaproteobacteria bacterium]|nr:hypothetical protein [Deltaproteobacteria bacterium]